VLALSQRKMLGLAALAERPTLSVRIVKERAPAQVEELPPALRRTARSSQMPGTASSVFSNATARRGRHPRTGLQVIRRRRERHRLRRNEELPEEMRQYRKMSRAARDCGKPWRIGMSSVVMSIGFAANHRVLPSSLSKRGFPPNTRVPSSYKG